MKVLSAMIPTLLLGSVALTLSSNALAAERVDAFDVPTRTISLKDVDLGEPGHLPIVYARVQQAASAVCDDTLRAERRLHRRMPAGWRARCVQSAVDRAVQTVNDQRLTALHSRSAELLAVQK